MTLVRRHASLTSGDSGVRTISQLDSLVSGRKIGRIPSFKEVRERPRLSDGSAKWAQAFA